MGTNVDGVCFDEKFILPSYDELRMPLENAQLKILRSWYSEEIP